MREHRLPPAEIVANPDALHELFIKAVAAGQPDPGGPDAPPLLADHGRQP